MRAVHTFYVLFLLIMMSMICFSCANQIALTGGPKDEIPPQLDTIKSTKNFQTLFVKQNIELYFDEFVDLANANEQIIISPPLENPPLISGRLERVKIEFDESEILKEDATYVINFGQSIRDYTEGNELENYTFVFSTGDYIDSLSMTGKVINARSQEPEREVLVLLYDVHSDSVVFTQKPFYFARTDETGEFRINNLRSDTFKIVALDDRNLNYLYDPSTERIGFLDTLIFLSDTAEYDFTLQMFKESTIPNYQSYDILNQGKLQINFDNIPSIDDIEILDSVTFQVEHEKEEQNLILWYQPRGKRSLRFTALRNNMLDTIQARINPRNADTLAGAINFVKANYDRAIGLHPFDTLSFTLDRPAISIDSTQIYLIDTAQNDTVPIRILSTDVPFSSLDFITEWQEESDFQLHLYPGAITDFFNRSNDTIEWDLAIAGVEEFGEIKLSFANRDSADYVVRLLKEEYVITSYIVRPEDTEVSIERLAPGTYTLEVIEDAFANGKWDPGNYMENKQSERIFTIQLEELRSNWLLEHTVDIAELAKSESIEEDEIDINQDPQR